MGAFTTSDEPTALPISLKFEYTTYKEFYMGIRVHDEIAQYSAVVNANCIRCLACTNACPNGTLSYRWGLNVLVITRRIKWLIPQQWNYNWYYELMLIFF